MPTDRHMPIADTDASTASRVISGH